MYFHSHLYFQKYLHKSLYFFMIHRGLSLLPVRQRFFSHTTRKPARIPRLLDHPAAVQRAVALGAGFGHHLWGGSSVSFESILRKVSLHPHVFTKINNSPSSLLCLK